MDALTRPDGCPLRVLVVDDEHELAELLRMALRYEGWETAPGATGTRRSRRPRTSSPTPSCST